MLGLEPGWRLQLPLGLFIWYHLIMKSAIENGTKKSKGRPATGIGLQIGARWSLDTVKEIDDWRRKQDDLPGRPEAIRRLVELGLKVKK